MQSCITVLIRRIARESLLYVFEQSKSISTSTGVDTTTSSSWSERVEHKLPQYMTQELKHRDVYKYYDIIKVLGKGSIGSVAMVQKKKEEIGGSARKDGEKSQ